MICYFAIKPRSSNSKRSTSYFRTWLVAAKVNNATSKSKWKKKLETDAKGGKLHNVRPVLVKRQNLHNTRKRATSSKLWQVNCKATTLLLMSDVVLNHGYVLQLGRDRKKHDGRRGGGGERKKNQAREKEKKQRRTKKAKKRKVRHMQKKCSTSNGRKTKIIQTENPPSPPPPLHHLF